MRGRFSLQLFVGFLAAVLVFDAAAGQDQTGAMSELGVSVDFLTADSVRVFGDMYRSSDAAAPAVLLFHQGGGNAQAEYATIIPVLVEAGYSVLAIDQRSGGSRLGGTNRTVEALEDRQYGYCDALPDLMAALDFSLDENLGDPVVVWGSSYSAALVIQLAVLRPDEVSAVLAFSPASGEPMAGCDPSEFAPSVKQPLLALRPAREMEIEPVAAQLVRLAELGHQTYVSEHGVHGSSMLNEARTEHSTAETWEVVLDFLKSVREAQ